MLTDLPFNIMQILLLRLIFVIDVFHTSCPDFLFLFSYNHACNSSKLVCKPVFVVYTKQHAIFDKHKRVLEKILNGV